MANLLIGLIVGLLVSLFGWLAKTVFLKRQLYLIQPRLFDYSELGVENGAKTVELTVINSGRRAEEDIQVQLAPSFKYTIMASNISGLVITDGVLSIKRLSPGQEVTVILFVEGGEFRKDHVSGLNSKEVIGKVKVSMQEARNTPAQNALAILAFLFIVLPVGYGVGKVVEIAFWPAISGFFAPIHQLSYALLDENKSSSFQLKEERRDLLLNQLKISNVRRVGDLVYVTVKLRNDTKKPLDFSLSLSTPVSDQRGKLFNPPNYIEGDILVYPDAEKNVTLSDYLPAGVDPQNFHFEAHVNSGSEYASLEQDYSLK